MDRLRTVGALPRRLTTMFRRTLRALAYLLYGLGTGIAALVTLVVAVTACAVLSLTHAGVPAFLAATSATRALAGLERRRAALVLLGPVPTPYRQADAATRAGRARQVAAHPATWRDIAWLTALFPLALASAVVAVVVLGVDLAALTSPAWVWALPAHHRHDNGFVTVTTPLGQVLTVLAAAALLPLLARLVRALAGGQARLAAALLASGRTQRLTERADRLTRTRARAIDAQAAELKRIERDLHDGAQARIVGLGMTLALAEHRLKALGAAADPARADLAAARREITTALDELRHLVRGIHPPILTDRGLDGALTALFADHPLPVLADVDLPRRLAPAVESAAYFLIAEALTNTAKHAQATHATVTAHTRPDRTLAVTVTDDGHGGADPDGPGLSGLRRRLDALDATLTLASPPGGPTRLHAEFPCAL
ncbi:sensor histidine kinase [Streptomyces sp. NPDC058459]|uniref:sensor histidine kinase n=1 Tax=Streptomyces sp. NPDC058459 TaxID=3346508 RepID=UPI00364F2AC2